MSREKEQGKVVYELETVVNGRSRDLMIDAAGKVYEVEEQIDPGGAPAPVKASLEAKGKIVALESVMRNGETHYEAKVRAASGKTTSVELRPDGTPLRSRK